MRHSYQMRMQRGVFSTRCAPYGYRLVDNQLEVIEDEAVVIRQIFDRYLSGVSMEDIAKEITARGIPTKQNTPFWQVRSIQYILRNEKYIGNSLVQKTYATVTLPIARKKIRRGGSIPHRRNPFAHHQSGSVRQGPAASIPKKRFHSAQGWYPPSPLLQDRVRTLRSDLQAKGMPRHRLLGMSDA